MFSNGNDRAVFFDRLDDDVAESITQGRPIDSDVELGPEGSDEWHASDVVPYLQSTYRNVAVRWEADETAFTVSGDGWAVRYLAEDYHSFPIGE